MAMPSSVRDIWLVDGRQETRPLIPAQLYRDYPPSQLDVIESTWAEARERAVSAGLVPLEHAHWDWTNKADRVKADYHLLVAIECEGEPQGIMAVVRNPRPARLDDGQVVYVDYLESAPWNLRHSSAQPRFLGVGTVLMADAVRLSLEMGLGGRVGLHSLPQAEVFYNKCRMTRWGIDLNYHELSYHELTPRGAAEWFAAIGESA
jgi:hypothetical protein